MNTLIIGDIHLQAGIILPWIKQDVLNKHKVNRIAFIGDYFDQWGQTGNNALYIKEMEVLSDFVTYAKSHNLQIDWLIGNHDAPYVLNQPEHYTSDDKTIRESICNLLKDVIRPKLTCNVGKYQLSHAGIASNHPYENIDVFTPEGYETLYQLNRADGHTLYGALGSPLWIRPNQLMYTEPYYKHQIFGHTPVKSITQLDAHFEAWNIDTFSLTSNMIPIGDGSVLLIDETDELKTIAFPNWTSGDMYINRLEYFNSTN